MGLDLEPLGRARPGHEAEWTKLTGRIYEDDELSESENERRNEISIPPYEDIGAPCVGKDAEADAWAIRIARENGLTETDAEVIENMRGYYASTLMILGDPAPSGAPFISPDLIGALPIQKGGYQLDMGPGSEAVWQLTDRLFRQVTGQKVGAGKRRTPSCTGAFSGLLVQLGVQLKDRLAVS